jgi:hypothetical protein
MYLRLAYWVLKSARLLMQNEFELNPDWSATLIGFNDSQEKLDKRPRISFGRCYFCGQ